MTLSVKEIVFVMCCLVNSCHRVQTIDVKPDNV